MSRYGVLEFTLNRPRVGQMTPTKVSTCIGSDLLLFSPLCGTLTIQCFSTCGILVRWLEFELDRTSRETSKGEETEPFL